jgi:microcystin-dependent protein
MCNTTCNGSEFVSLPVGSDGSDGLFGGYSMSFKFESAIITPPTPSYVRFNNATYASVTALYISDTAIQGAVGTWLDSFLGGGNYGYLRIFKEYDSSIFANFKVTAVADAGAYHNITVTYVSHSGSFVANDVVVASFAASGIDGEDALEYQGTSVTSINLSTLGATTSVTISPAETAFQIGTRIRVAATATPTTNYFEGVITAYNTGTGVISVGGIDNIVGTATVAAWTISVAGDKGATGATGSAAAMPTGVILDYSATSAPSGWLFCNGAAVSRTTYSALFAVTGTTFGAGDGATTFNLPDLQRRVRIGYDSTSAVDATPATPGQENYGLLNNKGGNSGVTLVKANLPTHQHTVNTSATDGGTVTATTTIGGGNASLVATVVEVQTDPLGADVPDTWSTVTHTATTTLSGNSGNGTTDGLAATTVENRTKYIVLYPIIKY